MWRSTPTRLGMVWWFLIGLMAMAVIRRGYGQRPSGQWRTLTGQDAAGITDPPGRHPQHPCPGGPARYERYDSIRLGLKAHWYVWEKGRQGLLDPMGQLVVACAYDSARPVAGQTYAVYRAGRGQLLAGTAPLQDSIGAIRYLKGGQAIWQAGATWWAHDSATGSLTTLPGQVRGHYRRGVWLSRPSQGGATPWQLMSLPFKPGSAPLVIVGPAGVATPKPTRPPTGRPAPLSHQSSLVSPRPTSPRFFPAGSWALVQSGKQTFLMGPTGQWRSILLPTIDTLLPARDGVMAFRSHGSWGFLDTLGYIRMSARYASAGSFHEGAAAIRIGRRWGLINRGDELVCQPVYDTLVALAHGWHWGTKEGTAYLIRPGEAQRIGLAHSPPPRISAGGFIIGQGHQYGYLDRQGQMILPIAYEEITCLPTGAILVHAQQRWRLYSETGTPQTAFLPGFARYDPCRQALYVDRAVSP